MRQSRHLLSREELEALIAASACIETHQRPSLRVTMARLLRWVAAQIARLKLS
jgi:hypothetical protein